EQTSVAIIAKTSVPGVLRHHDADRSWTVRYANGQCRRSRHIALQRAHVLLDLGEHVRRGCVPVAFARRLPGDDQRPGRAGLSVELLEEQPGSRRGPVDRPGKESRRNLRLDERRAGELHVLGKQRYWS